MEYRILGKTELKISRLGFGGIPIQKIDAEGTKKLIDELVVQGVNFIDTAAIDRYPDQWPYIVPFRRQRVCLRTARLVTRIR